VSDVVVDTNVISYLFKGDTRASLYLPHLAGVSANISFMTLAEMHFGAERRHWGAYRRHRLHLFLRGYPVIQSTPEICHLWAEIMAMRERQGRAIENADAWIAACALRYSAPLVTHDRKDFAAIPELHVISAQS
jgi:tRNA(fMet)-specific endonuclease VapC